jgi:DNA repair exonuclease SbcCD ATPase subunit
MANEVEKSISISYKADLKDLVSKLKQMPNVTDQEAKKMVKALDRQLKQAEKAAKKSAEASKKASQEAARAAARGASSFDDLADSARRAEDRLERVGESAGDIDRGFSSIGLALRGVNPQLAEAADGLADAMAVTEGLSMSFSALNPFVLASAVAIGGAVLAYQSYQNELESARQLTLDMREAQRSLNLAYREQASNFMSSLDKLAEVRDQYELLTGEIDEYQVALNRVERQTKATFQGNIDQQQKLIDQRNEELDMVKAIMEGNLKSVQYQAVLSDSQKDSLKNLQLITKGVNKRVDLTAHDYTLNNELAKIQKALVNEIAKQEQGMAILVNHQKEAVDMALQIQEYENESAKAKEKQVKPAEEKVDLLKDENDELEKLLEAEQKYFDKQIDANKKLEDFQIDAFMTKEQREALAFGEKLKQIEELGEETGKTELAAEIIKQELHQKDLDRLEELKEKRKEGAKENLEALFQAGEAFANLAESRMKTHEVDFEARKKEREALAAMSETERAAHEKKKKQMTALFNFRKGMAIAEIAMGTAEAVVAAQKLIPPFNLIQSALAVATGVAQAGVVMSQQAPQFHMGGMAPDETSARVLKGEAILDRATVRNLGGEQGVKQLQQNQGPAGGQVMVIQPFKHFGRFTREIGLKKPKMTGIAGY